MIGMENQNLKQNREMAEFQKILQMVNEPRNLKLSDYLDNPMETWGYILHIVNYQWLDDISSYPPDQLSLIPQKFDKTMINNLFVEKYNIATKIYLEQQKL